MLDAADPVRVGEHAGLLVQHQRVGIPTGPQLDRGLIVADSLAALCQEVGEMGLCWVDSSHSLPELNHVIILALVFKHVLHGF